MARGTTLTNHVNRSANSPTGDPASLSSTPSPDLGPRVPRLGTRSTLAAMEARRVTESSSTVLLRLPRAGSLGPLVVRARVRGEEEEGWG
eukprot:3364496-Rhodomonas_salina.1